MSSRWVHYLTDLKKQVWPFHRYTYFLYGKVVPMHTINVHVESGGTTPPICNVSNKQRWMVSSPLKTFHHREKPLVSTTQEHRKWVGGWWATDSLSALGRQKFLANDGNWTPHFLQFNPGPSHHTKSSVHSSLTSYMTFIAHSWLMDEKMSLLPD